MLTVSSTQLCNSYPIIEFSEKQFACRDCYKKYKVAICELSNSHWWKAVRLSPCTSVSTKSCADCRTFCEYNRMQEVAAVCMQEVACRLHAACIRSYAGDAGCSILHAGCSRLHAGCMQPACISSGALALQILWLAMYTCICTCTYTHTYILFYTVFGKKEYPWISMKKVSKCSSIFQIQKI